MSIDMEQVGSVVLVLLLGIFGTMKLRGKKSSCIAEDEAQRHTYTRHP